MNKRYLFFGFLALTAGILCFCYLPFYWLLAILLPLSCVVLFIISRKRSILSIFIMITLLLGIVTSSINYREYTDVHTKTAVSGTVSKFEFTDNGYRIYLDRCDFADTEQVESVSVLLIYGSEDLPFPLTEGCVISVSGTASPMMLGKNSNPNLADTRFSALSGPCYRIYSTKISLLKSDTDLNYTLRTLKDAIRRIIFSSVHHSNSASVLYTMLTGDSSHLTPEAYNIFLSCGTSHIIAVSGLHFSILLSLLAVLLKRFRLSSTVTFLITLLFIAAYSAFTGFSPSVIRASIMAIAMSVGIILSERYDPLNSLGLSGILILLLDPFAIFDVSFQLSFLACFGILVSLKYTVSTKYRLLNIFINAGILTLGATVFTLPLHVFYFGSVSIISVIANMLFVPVMSPVLMLIALFVPIAALFPSMRLLLKIPGYITQGVLALSALLGKAPMLTVINVTGFSLIGIIAISIFLTRFINILPSVKRKICAVLLIFITVFSVSGSFYRYNNVFISVPYVSSRSDTVHIEGKCTYVIGLSESDIPYLQHNAYNIDCLFLLNDAHASAYDSLENVKIKSIYCLPCVNISKKARLDGAVYLNEAITLPDGSFQPLNDGIVFTKGNDTLYVGEGETQRYFTVAVTKSTVTRGKTVITNGLFNGNCDKFFDIRINGYTRIPFRS